MLISLFIAFDKFRAMVALLDQRSCAYADRRGGALRRTAVLWRGARCVHAQVDPFLPYVNLLALLRPQIFEPACCEDSSTGGKLDASSTISLTSPSRSQFLYFSGKLVGSWALLYPYLCREKL